MAKENKPTLILLVGLPRSGKSTWIEENKGSAIVVSNDWIRENILGTHYSDKANAVVWSIADATLRIVLGQGNNAIYDGVNLTKAVRRFYIDLARQYGAKIRIVVMDTSLETCLKRNKKHNKLPDAALEKMAKMYEEPEKSEYDEIEHV